ncbi:MAG: hypothetical protein WCO55_00855 [Candidatus Falkowbacteria bacterium]
MKKLYLLSALALVAILAVGWVLADVKNKTAKQPLVAVGVPIFYYGDGCPHCANVEDYLSANPLPAAYQLDKKEVYKNTVNKNELIARAKSCGIKGAVTIPVLYTKEGKCLVGDIDIIAYFKALK